MHKFLSVQSENRVFLCFRSFKDTSCSQKEATGHKGKIVPDNPSRKTILDQNILMKSLCACSCVAQEVIAVVFT